MNPEDFKNPGKTYRPSPFWSWNNLLDEEELRWQVREFKDKGYGGYFMHSRVGLATIYLSKEWMRCVRACLEEGKRNDLESWLYDEDKWPSGFAGGIVPAKNEEYRSRFALLEEIEPKEVAESLKDPSVLGVYEVKFTESNEIESFKRIRKPEDVEGLGRLYAFKFQVAGCSNWFNGESYVDLLNPRVTEEFLKVTIDAYAEEFRDSFGEFMPGIFTDEPNYAHWRTAATNIPWTGEMADYFKRENGYDLLDKAPLLYYDGEGSSKVRYDFWRTVTKRFIEAWTIPYSERCERLGLKMTGHYLCEDNFVIQIQRIGAAMPHYEYMHVPGIDHLGRNIENPLTLIQCSSVAHQFGRKRILCEIFGCSGHSMTFEDQKWIADFHFALGITFLCPHLTLYTMKGDAKRDYPPTFSYHQPYWPYYKLINDYFARACYVCSQGNFQADILLLHSIGSAWATYSPRRIGDRSSKPWRYNDALVKVLTDLLALHWGFDLGDEMIIARHGRVEGGRFMVNKASYSLVIVPPSLTWSGETYKLLSEFLDGGGRVIFIGETPTMIDGKPAEEEWSNLLKHPGVVRIEADRDALEGALNRLLTRWVSVKDDSGREIEDIYVHHRIDGVKHIYFLSNKSRTETYDAKITLRGVGEVTEWNLLEGSISKIPVKVEGGKTILKVRFHPAGSHVFVLDTSKEPHISKVGMKRVEERVVKLPDVWNFERLHPNSMTLDTCQYSIDGGEWSDRMPVWKVRREVWKEAGLEPYTGIQPWVLIKRGIKPTRTFNLHIKTTFKSEVEGKRIYLVIERGEKWSLKVNGEPVPTDVEDWHWDKQFRKVDISDHVRVGENVIELSCRYGGIDTPVEDLYLIGDFGVKKLSETEYAITEEPKTLRNGSWVEQGYPFYAGSILYKTKVTLERKPGERVLIRLPKARGSLFLIHVNDGDPVPICWEPLEADITEFIKDGENAIAIEVVSSLRNTFGPLHHKLGDLTWVGPHSFVDEENWVDSYQFAPYGLIEGAEMLIRREA
ncbi:hypothetical protein DRO55_00665 [Candidatus Bathyarchaeota archaeon]|nr:MAG: hypothetical protein DRO55_00665 [Candidatus Bathyarchaeota archaeon]